MPNHSVHMTAATITGVAVGCLAAQGVLPVHDAAALGVAVVLAERYLSPDLDVISAPYYHWKKLKWLWLPYQKLIKHRSLLSHCGPFSATLRILYIGFPLLLLCWYLDTVEQMWYYLAMIWIAACIADTVHTVLDYVW